MRRIVLAVALIGAVALSGQYVTADHGQDHPPMLIQIQHYQEVNLNPTEHTPSLHPSSLLYGSISVLVDGVDCGTTALPPVENRPGLEGQIVATIPVGTPSQPAACNNEGARVSFVNGRGQHLAVTFTFEGGARATFSNFVPDAFQPGVPGDGVSTGPVALPGAGSGALGGRGTPNELTAGLAAAGVVLMLVGAAAWVRRSPRSG